MKKILNSKKIPVPILIGLMKLRLKNLKYVKPTKIILEDIIFSDSFSCIVSSKEFADMRQGMTLEKFYINEIEFLMTEGILNYSYSHNNNKVKLEIEYNC
jgi:hypothetical protein